MNSSATWMMMTSRRESRLVGRSSGLKKLVWTSCLVRCQNRRRLPPLLLQQELPHLLLRHCTLALVLPVLLLVLVPASVAQNCSTKCGSMDVAYPFGLEPGCGRFEFRDLLNCSRDGLSPDSSLQLYINVSPRDTPLEHFLLQVLQLDYGSRPPVITVQRRWPIIDCSLLNGDAVLDWGDSEPGSEHICQSNFPTNLPQNCSSCTPPQPDRVCGYDTSSGEALCVASCASGTCSGECADSSSPKWVVGQKTFEIFSSHSLQICPGVSWLD